MEETKQTETNKPPKARCFNCVFGGNQFKIANTTYLHCLDKKQYPDEKFESGELTGWDSLKRFSDTCKNHEFKAL